METSKTDKIDRTIEDLKSPLIKIAEIPFDRTHKYHLDYKSNWVQEFQKELSSKNESNSEIPVACDLVVDFELTRVHDPDFDNPVVLEGEISGEYGLECIRCLEPMSEHFSFSFQAGFLPKNLENDAKYEDQLTIFAKNKELDLYFFDKQQINLKDLITEILYLNREEYPLHDDMCKGLCQFCGTNLNTTNCTCGTKNA